MSPARLHALIFAAASLLAVALVWRSSATPPARSAVPQSPLSAVPQGAMLVATLDAKKFRETRLGAALLSEGGDLPGIGPIVDVCGFDPTLEVGTLTFALPGIEAETTEEAPIEFGLAAYGAFSGERVATCASTAITHRGGSPVTTKVGSFTSIRQRHGSHGEIAARDRGPVLLGAGRYLREMIDAADGRVPNANRDERHRALRTSLGEDGMFLVTWLLPRGWLQNLVESELARLSPLAAVDRAAMRVDVGERVLVTLAIGCNEPAACGDLVEVTKSLVETEIDPLLRAQFPDAKQRFRVLSTAGQVRVSLWLDETEAIKLILLVVARMREPPASDPSTEPSWIPDEVLRPPASSR